MFRPALIALAVLVASPASAYLARNGERVEGTAAQFTVRASPGQGAPQSWCAAGDFVIARLGLSRLTPVWRLDEPPRRSGQGVRFSVNPEGAASRSGLNRLGERDASMTASAAQALCWDSDRRRRR